MKILLYKYERNFEFSAGYNIYIEQYYERNTKIMFLNHIPRIRMKILKSNKTKKNYELLH